jgi:DNA-binding beta-propeller fold protein YncE
MRFVLGLALIGAAVGPARSRAQLAPQEQRLLYVVVSGSGDADPDRSVRILVFDIANAHRFVKRIPVWPAGGDREDIRGAAANARTGRLFISTTSRLAAIDLRTDKIVWERKYESHCCERIAVSPDGQTIYAPAFGSPKWYVIAAASGDLRATIDVTGWPRDTIYSRDGRHAYLAAWESSMLAVSDTASHEVVRQVGPFSAFLCPFALNAAGTLAFVNVDGLVGFEVGDLRTGLVLDRVEASGDDKDAAANYECPSHGIAFTPDARELWVADGVHNRLLVFDAGAYPPVARGTVDLPTQPRWITFSLDGRYAYSSSGDVVGAEARTIAGALEDAAGVKVSSEYIIEIDFVEGQPIRSAGRE